MKILIKNALILDCKSGHYKKEIDVLIENGQILKLGVNILQNEDVKIITGQRLVLSPVFIDINATSGEPNRIEAESLESFIHAGIRGGFGYIAHIPNNQKRIQSKADVQYLRSYNSSYPCQILPFGNIVSIENDQNMSPLMDMHHAGAVAFTVGNEDSVRLNVLTNALLYAKSFQGKIAIHPEKKELSKNGQVTQGEMSVLLGFKGTPKEAEFMAVQEIIQLANYTDSDVLLYNITTPESLAIIQSPNTSERQIYSSISIHHLYFSETSLSDYNTHLKINPPLRSESDRRVMIDAVLTGKIDIVYSQHIPCTPEEKELEFDLASYGAISLQTTFLSLLEVLGEENIEDCIRLLSIQPARYLGINLNALEEYTVANFTLIDLGDTTEWCEEANVSKSKNSPYFGKTFKGRIRGVVSNHNQSFF